MADEKPAKKRVVKKSETIRERAEKSSKAAPKRRVISKTAGTAAKPFKAAHRIGQKSYYLPLPDKGFWGFMNKHRRFFPRFFIDAVRELRQVTWPGRKETWKLTSAVFIFAIVFGIIITITDYGLDKIFRKVFLK